MFLSAKLIYSTAYFMNSLYVYGKLKKIGRGGKQPAKDLFSFVVLEYLHYLFLRLESSEGFLSEGIHRKEAMIFTNKADCIT